MAIEITGKQFNPRLVKKFVQKSFEKQGLAFSDKDPELSKRLVRESGSSLAHTTLFLKSGLKLKLGIKFDVKRGKIESDSKGLIYTAKLDGTTIPLAKPKGEDYDWTSWIKKIADFVKKREEKQVKKPPTVSKARATDDKIPSSFKGKLEAKKAELGEKKAELSSQDAALAEQTAENTKLETEIEAFKGKSEGGILSDYEPAATWNEFATKNKAKIDENTDDIRGSVIGTVAEHEKRSKEEKSKKIFEADDKATEYTDKLYAAFNKK